MDRLEVLLELNKYEDEYYNHLYASFKADQMVEHPELNPEVPEDFELSQINEVS